MTPQDSVRSLVNEKGYSYTDIASMVRDKKGISTALTTITRLYHEEGTVDPRWTLGNALIELNKRLRKKK